MVYNVGEFRKSIDNYFFEADEFNNIHVYKKGSLEYLDMIDIDYKLDYDEFIFRCKEWLNNNKK